MPVRVTRRRGAASIWYAGGTVKVGQERRNVAEYSTGCTDRASADHVAATLDARIRREILEGPSRRPRAITIAEALTEYVGRPGGVRSYDAARILEYNQMIGDRPLTEAVTAWGDWLRARGARQQPSSVARWRSTLQAALTHGAEALGVPAPRLPGVRGASGPERAIYLPEEQRQLLLASYNPHAACPILILAYQGLRTQEALRMDWRHVAFTRREIVIPADGTKTGRGRVAPMHDKVDGMLFGMWHAAGRPGAGPVFHSARGEPYADTRGRDGGRQGGNPLSQAHETACRRAGVEGFRVHDWRHDWAVRMVMAKVDLVTLQQLGGWSSIRMVQRYAMVTADHMAEAIRRIA